MTIAQALLKKHKEELEKDTETVKIAPLMQFLEYIHRERHVKLCLWCGIEPLSIGKWLRKPVDSLI